jgi:hypothetical protein
VPSCTLSNNSFRTYLGKSTYDLRVRTGYLPPPPNPPNGAHSPDGEYIHNSFIPVLDNIFVEINTWMNLYTGLSIDWIGHIGANVCKANSWHANGQAIDLTAIHSSPTGGFIDCNTTWRPERTLQSKRLYLAVAATARRFAATVITAYPTSDTAHDNHIHIDNGTALQPITPSWSTDTSLVQAASNLLMGTNLTLDGLWGSQTQVAYVNLQHTLGMACLNPGGNLSHCQTFLRYIGYHAFSNRAAGYYRYSGC